MMSQQQSSTEHPHEVPTTAGTSAHTGDVAGVSRLIVGTACEVLGGFAHASAEALQSVNAHFEEPRPSLVTGLLRGNARFLEEMSHTMEGVATRFQTKGAPAPEHEGSTKPETSDPA